MSTTPDQAFINNQTGIAHQAESRGPAGDSRQRLHISYSRLRQASKRICAPLEIEDYGIQTMPDVSPPKWHLAHTSWFFETFLLKPFLPEYREFHPLYSQLFNSYYNSIGEYHPRPERGFLSRPTVEQVYAYRSHVDEHMQHLINSVNDEHWQDVLTRTQLGINHEQQHQELMLTDIKHIFACNPLRPKYRNTGLGTPHVPDEATNTLPSTVKWFDYQAKLTHQGYDTTGDTTETIATTDTTTAAGFHYDNETPSHPILIRDFKVASRLVNNQEMISFIEDGGYKNASLWLSGAWQTVSEQQWLAPLYWEKHDDEWWYMTLSGMQVVDPLAPVCHVSYYEADAVARWAGKRLLTEQEWEHIAKPLPITGNFRESDLFQPAPPSALTTDSGATHSGSMHSGPTQIYGDVWEWTRSSYTSYPGFDQSAFSDFSGEYNAKFMSNQMVLRGGSCVTPRSHIRPTYRNFFYPTDRWQFSGFRLAEDA